MQFHLHKHRNEKVGVISGIARVSRLWLSCSENSMGKKKNFQIKYLHRDWSRIRTLVKSPQPAVIKSLCHCLKVPSHVTHTHTHTVYTCFNYSASVLNTEGCLSSARLLKQSQCSSLRNNTEVYYSSSVQLWRVFMKISSLAEGFIKWEEFYWEKSFRSGLCFSLQSYPLR